MNLNLFEKKLESMSSGDFNKISAKDEDWKYLGKKIFELHDIKVGSNKEIQPVSYTHLTLPTILLV